MPLLLPNKHSTTHTLAWQTCTQVHKQTGPETLEHYNTQIYLLWNTQDTVLAIVLVTFGKGVFLAVPPDFQHQKENKRNERIYPLLSWPGVAEQEGSLVEGNQGEESRDRIDNAPFGFVLCRPFRF